MNEERQYRRASDPRIDDLIVTISELSGGIKSRIELAKEQHIEALRRFDSHDEKIERLTERVGETEKKTAVLCERWQSTRSRRTQFITWSLTAVGVIVAASALLMRYTGVF